MADFGLAAQIGRGGGGNAMVQPVDPVNRMTQMMQLQQLQQNMMLAREQEARAAAFEPLRVRNLEADIRGSLARAGVAETQGKMLDTEREEQLRKLRLNRGMFDVMDRADRGLLNLSSPEGLNSITDPEIRSAVRSQLTAAREAADKAQKANLEMTGVQRAIAYNFVDRFGEGITGPRQYQAARDKILKVDPAAAEFLPDNFNADNASQLRDFVRDRKTSIQMVNGVPVMVTEGSPVARELIIERAAPSPNFGGLSSFQSTPMAPGAASAAAAGVPADMGAAQGIIGQRAPAGGEAGAGPATTSRLVSGSEFVSAPKPLTAQQQIKLRNEIASDFKSASSTIDQMQGVIAAAKEVSDLPPSVKDSITGWSGYVPSFRADTRTGDVKLNNLKGKVTQLGRQAASLSGAIGSMAVQEWKIVSDMIANLDEKGMNPADLDRQMALIESQAQGTVNRIRDAYERQYAEEFSRFGDRFKLPEPRAAAASASSAPQFSPEVQNILDKYPSRANAGR